MAADEPPKGAIAVAVELWDGGTLLVTADERDTVADLNAFVVKCTGVRSPVVLTKPSREKHHESVDDAAKLSDCPTLSARLHSPAELGGPVEGDDVFDEEPGGPGGLAARHERWLRAALAHAAAQDPMIGPFVTHDDLTRNADFAHFGHDERDMIWRFTSAPQDERLYIARGAGLREILEVTARHSGGNDKSNERVQTLSFGRNRGALIGVAASAGGDKNVLDIVERAEYLYGVRISSLAQRGISAHPALARGISAFETEYVLVNSPGNPSISLDEVAERRYPNPLKGQISTDPVLGTQYQERLPPRAESNKIDKANLDTVPEGLATGLLRYARVAMKTADNFAGAIRNRGREPDLKLLGAALDRFGVEITAGLGGRGQGSRERVRPRAQRRSGSSSRPKRTGSTPSTSMPPLTDP